MTESETIINTYGRRKLSYLYMVTCQQDAEYFAKCIKELLKRDAPNLAKKYKWGGFKNMTNAIIRGLYVCGNN